VTSPVVTIAQFAAQLGIQPGSLRMKLHRSRVAREHGRTFMGIIPEPDADIGGSTQAWLPETVAAYLEGDTE